MIGPQKSPSSLGKIMAEQKQTMREIEEEETKNLQDFKVKEKYELVEWLQDKSEELIEGPYFLEGVKLEKIHSLLLLQEAKLVALKRLIGNWIEKQDQDKCWYYPDIFRAITLTLNIDVKQEKLPPREEFEEGCKKYQEELYGNNPK